MPYCVRTINGCLCLLTYLSLSLLTSPPIPSRHTPTHSAVWWVLLLIKCEFGTQCAQHNSVNFRKQISTNIYTSMTINLHVAIFFNRLSLPHIICLCLLLDCWLMFLLLLVLLLTLTCAVRCLCMCVHAPEYRVKYCISSNWEENHESGSKSEIHSQLIFISRAR